MLSFRGASAEAVAALVDRLAELVGDAPQEAGTLAEELFSVAATLRGEGALRRFATDPSMPSEAKTGLVAQVFGEKVAEAALTLVQDAVGRRWTSAGDLPRGIEHLSVVAAVRSAGSETGRLSDELFAVERAIRDNPSLRDALSDPSRSTADKESLVRTLLGDRALEATRTLTVQALAGTYRTVGSALEAYQKVAADVHGEHVATVRVARALSEDETRRLEQTLARHYDRPVHLNMVVEPDVLGGVRVEIGDDVIDGTVASRLAEARRRLAG